MKHLYAAYGANTNIESMQSRCVDSSPFGGYKDLTLSRALLPNYKLTFNKFADVRPHANSSVEVALWEISSPDFVDLDYFEGYPYYYGKKQVPVTLANGQTMLAWIYYMKDNNSIAAPSKSYLQLLRDGYNAFTLNANQIDQAIAEVDKKIVARKNIGKFKYGRR
jgi:gamma-glutamylcyclotransferase (GGCT)/AIG2-like uncharacterized protein YtfP